MRFLSLSFGFLLGLAAIAGASTVEVDATLEPGEIFVGRLAFQDDVDGSGGIGCRKIAHCGSIIRSW